MAVCMGCCLLCACGAYRESQYLQNEEALKGLEEVKEMYDYCVRPKDVLNITVSTSDPQASAPFYRKIGQARNEPGGTQGMSDANLLEYLVDVDGRIDFPVLGMLQVEGLTLRECENLIRQKTMPYLNETPNVTVRVRNYRYCVLGEVGRPGVYESENGRVTLFEALAQAGDMTLFAERSDVKLLREDSAGHQEVVHLDLTEADIALSPYYYMQQNDVLYVKPRRSRVRSNTFSSNSSAWISLLSLASSITSVILVGILR